MNGIFDDFKNAFSRPNNGLIQIILINIVVFLFIAVVWVVLKFSNNIGFLSLVTDQLELPSSLYRLLYKPWTLFTYFFTHQDIFHILFNMLFLYWFGKIIDEYLGNRRLINLYILGGLVGGILYIAMYNLLPYFANQVELSTMLGASGAVYAVVVGAATLMPNYTFHLLFIGPVRIKWIAIFYVVISFVQLRAGNEGGNFAHLGGALLGFIYIKQLRNGVDIGRPVTAIAGFFSSLFKKKPVMRVTYQNKNKSVAGGYGPTHSIPNQDEIDMILDKINRSGYESLTKEEKQKLFKASQKKE